MPFQVPLWTVILTFSSIQSILYSRIQQVRVEIAATQFQRNAQLPALSGHGAIQDPSSLALDMGGPGKRYSHLDPSMMAVTCEFQEAVEELKK